MTRAATASFRCSLALLFALFLSQCGAVRQFGSFVFRLDESNFNKTTTFEWMTLVLWTHPQLAKECGAAVNELEKIAEDMDGKVYIAQVDCSRDASICRRYQVSAFPSLTLITLGQPTVPLTGVITAEAVHKAVLERAFAHGPQPPPIKPHVVFTLKDAASLDKFLNYFANAVVAFLAPSDAASNQYQAFKKAAKTDEFVLEDMLGWSAVYLSPATQPLFERHGIDTSKLPVFALFQHKVLFAAHALPAVAAAAAAAASGAAEPATAGARLPSSVFPAPLALPSGVDSIADAAEDELLQLLSDWILYHCVPLLEEAGKRNLAFAQEGGLTVLQLFVDPLDLAVSNAARELVARVALSLRGGLRAFWLDGVRHRKLLIAMGCSGDELPTVVVARSEGVDSSGSPDLRFFTWESQHDEQLDAEVMLRWITRHVAVGSETRAYALPVPPGLTRMPRPTRANKRKPSSKSEL